MFKEKWKKNVPTLAKAIAQNLPLPLPPPPFPSLVAFSTLETIVFRGPYNGRSSGTDLRLPRHKGEASRTVNKVVPVSFHGFRQKGEIQPFFVAGLRFEDLVSRGPRRQSKLNAESRENRWDEPLFIDSAEISNGFDACDHASSSISFLPCTVELNVYL